MIAKLDELRSRALGELDSIDTSSGLEAWRIRYLGRKSALTEDLRGLATLPLHPQVMTLVLLSRLWIRC